MKPLTYDDLVRTFDEITARSTYREPTMLVDERKLIANGIGYFNEGGTFLFSSGGLKKAREIGAIRPI